MEIDGATIFFAPGSLFQEVAKKRLLRPSMHVGYEAEYCSAATSQILPARIKVRTLIPTVSFFSTLTAVKDEEELTAIREAVAITDRVFKKILPLLKPGVMEREIAAEITYWHRMFGAEADSFEPIVASGSQGALPHANPSEKKIQSGDMVVMDFGCRVRGYCSDMTRTVAVGKPHRELKKIYGIVLEAQQGALDRVRAGVSAKAIDAAARAVIRKAGYGKYFLHSLGHGVGLHIHEDLRLSAKSKAVLQEGNVVTVEPGIYLPGLGGVRIEDDIIVTSNGCAILNRSPKELLIV
jgi:Xaa-Pro aminopeptidase